MEAEIDAEIIKLGTKHRYELMGLGDEVENMTKEERTEHLKETDRQRQQDRRDRQIVQDKKVDFGLIRPSEMTFNTRTLPPVEATRKAEAAILVQGESIKRTVTEHMKKTEQETVLTDVQEKGRRRLAKRVKDGQILITYTDKDARTVICTPDDYKQAARVHTSKDMEVEWSILEPTITRMNRTAKAVVRMFRVGQGGSQSQRDRINKAVITQDT